MHRKYKIMSECLESNTTKNPAKCGPNFDLQVLTHAKFENNTTTLFYDKGIASHRI